MRAVFFDLYGTLLRYGDMQTAWSAWLTELHRRVGIHGLALSEGELASVCDGFFARPEPEVADDGFTIFERRIDALCHTLRLDLPASEITHLADGIVDVWQGHVTVDPEARPLLESLRQQGRALVLISNFDHPPHVRRVLARAEMTDLFDLIVISGEVGVKKPAPEIFQLALDHLRIDASDAVHIGDTDDDILGAAAARIHAVAIVPDDARSHALDFSDREAEAAAPSRRFAAEVPTITRLSDLLALLR